MSGIWPLTARAALLEDLGRWYADRSVGGVVVTGAAGVGKTRLAEEVLRQASAAGRPVARAVGHPATQPIPLGGLAHLLPADLGLDVGSAAHERAGLFHTARVALGQLAGQDRLLLLVDDVDQLDDTSLALLLPLTLDRVLFPVVTVRSGRLLPGTIASLLKDGHLQRVELSPLRRDDVSTLLHRVLDGPLEAGALERLATVSQGNLQVLHELVRGAMDRGTLRRDGIVWRLESLPTTGALDELVTSHVAELPEDARRTVELLAVAGRLGLTDLEVMAPGVSLESLEAEGFLRVSVDGRRVEVTLAHPLYGEVLRSRLSVLRERAAQRALADELERYGARRRDDAVRLARWRLEAGGEVDAALLLRAGRLALLGRDAPLARRFASAAAERGAATEAARVAVEAAVLQARPADVEEAVAGVWSDPAMTDAQRAHLTRALAETRFAYGDLEGALRANERGRAASTDASAVASLVAHRATLLANAGRPLRALEVLDEVPETDDPHVRVELATARAVALFSTGRFDDAVAVVHRAQAAQQELPSWLARRGTARHLVNEAHALAYAGHLHEARALMADASDHARRAGALAAHVWFEIVLGEIARDAGFGHEAIEHFRAASELAEPAGQPAALVWAKVGIPQGLLLLGEADEAEKALIEADAVGDSPIGASSGTRERCRAWLAAARGDLTGAMASLLRVAAEARQDGLYNFESGPLHDVVRFGDPARVVERLEDLSASMQGPLIRARALHARGAANRSTAILLEALDLFEDIGFVVFAAEVAAELAELLRRHGDQRAAAAVGQRMRTLVERSGGARTPPLLRGAGVEPLTSREREVALLAADGLPSREIAERLYLSKRTVDTHLDRIYRKLGINGRDELAGALSPGT